MVSASATTPSAVVARRATLTWLLVCWTTVFSVDADAAAQPASAAFPARRASLRKAGSLALDPGHAGTPTANRATAASRVADPALLRRQASGGGGGSASLAQVHVAVEQKAVGRKHSDTKREAYVNKLRLAWQWTGTGELNEHTDRELPRSSSVPESASLPGDFSLLEVRQTGVEQLEDGTQHMLDVVLGPHLGAGGNGQVYKAAYIEAATVDEGWQFAVKVGSKASIAVEKRAAHDARVHRCKHVLTLPGIQRPNTPSVTLFECELQDGECEPGTSVEELEVARGWDVLAMPLYDGDLLTWLNSVTAEKALACEDRVMSQVEKGLWCFHTASWVHLDLKPDNILYKGIDKDGCPLESFLADFGLSRKVGTVMKQINVQYRKAAAHNADILFGTGTLTVDPELDEYSLKYVRECGFQEKCDQFFSRA